MEEWQTAMKADQVRAAPRRSTPFGEDVPEERRNRGKRGPPIRAKKNVPVASRRKKKHAEKKAGRRGAARGRT